MFVSGLPPLRTDYLFLISVRAASSLSETSVLRRHLSQVPTKTTSSGSPC
jgi:hypothetical protein